MQTITGCGFKPFIGRKDILTGSQRKTIRARHLYTGVIWTIWVKKQLSESGFSIKSEYLNAFKSYIKSFQIKLLKSCTYLLIIKNSDWRTKCSKKHQRADKRFIWWFFLQLNGSELVTESKIRPNVWTQLWWNDKHWQRLARCWNLFLCKTPLLKGSWKSKTIWCTF